MRTGAACEADGRLEKPENRSGSQPQSKMSACKKLKADVRSHLCSLQLGQVYFALSSFCHANVGSGPAPHRCMFPGNWAELYLHEILSGSQTPAGLGHVRITVTPQLACTFSALITPRSICVFWNTASLTQVPFSSRLRCSPSHLSIMLAFIHPPPHLSQPLSQPLLHCFLHFQLCFISALAPFDTPRRRRNDAVLDHPPPPRLLLLLIHKPGESSLRRIGCPPPPSSNHHRSPRCPISHPPHGSRPLLDASKSPKSAGMCTI